LLAPVFPVTAYSVSPAGHAVPPLAVAVTPVTLVEPVPFQVIVPEPVVRLELENVPLDPVLALSLHLESVPVVAMFPASALHTMLVVAGVLAEAGPTKPTVTTEIGSAQRAITEKARRIYFPLAGGRSPLVLD